MKVEKMKTRFLSSVETFEGDPVRWKKLIFEHGGWEGGKKDPWGVFPRGGGLVGGGMPAIFQFNISAAYIWGENVL